MGIWVNEGEDVDAIRKQMIADSQIAERTPIRVVRWQTEAEARQSPNWVDPPPAPGPLAIAPPLKR